MPITFLNVKKLRKKYTLCVSYKYIRDSCNELIGLSYTGNIQRG